MIKKLLNNPILKDSILSIGAKCVVFGVLQIIIYPLLNKSMGTEVFGLILAQFAVINIFSYAYGEALCNIRVLNQREDKKKSAEYLLLAALSVIVVLAALIAYIITIEKGTPGEGLMLGVIAALMMLRLYGESVFRIDINYKKILCSSILSAAGYLAGYFLYKNGWPWPVVFIAGEGIAVAFGGIIGKVFKVYRERGRLVSQLSLNYLGLSTSYLPSYALTNLDRLLVLHLINSEAVTIYYAATLYGKTVALFVPPVSSVLLSNFSKGNIKTTKKVFRNITLISLAGILAFTLAGMVAGRILIYLLYPEVYESAVKIIDLCTLGQIIYYGCSMLNMMAFKVCGIRFQMKVEIVYSILFLLMTIGGALTMGLAGFALGTLVANICRFIIFTVFVYRKLAVTLAEKPDNANTDIN